MDLKLDLIHNRPIQFLAALLLITITSISPAAVLAAQSSLNIPDVSNLLLSADTVTGLINPELAGATGPVQVVVQLTTAPLAVAYGANAKQLGGRLTPAQQH